MKAKRPKTSTSVPVVRAQPAATFLSSLPYHAAIIAAAVAWYYAAPFVVLAGFIAALYLLIKWLEPRYPFAAYLLVRIVYGFVMGLIGSRRGYRSWW